MSHFGVNANGVKNTPKEWLPIGKAVGELANKWSDRTDLVAYVGTDLKAPAPALYNPTSSEIEVNNEIAFGSISPKLIPDLSDPENHYEVPKAIGAIFHEACHAKFSRWSLEGSSKDLTRGQNEALHYLEEIRIENWGAITSPTHRYFLSACALEIVLGDLKKEGNIVLLALAKKREVAKLATLIMGRIDIGIIDKADVEDLVKVFEKLLGEELIANLRELWLQAKDHSNHLDITAIYPLAIEWDRLVADESKGGKGGKGGDKGKGKGKGEGEPDPDSDPTSDEGEGEGKGESDDTPDFTEKSIEEMLDEIEKAKDNIEVRSNEKLTDQQIDKFWKDHAKSRSDKANEKAEHKKSGQRVFGEPETEKGGTNGSGSKLVEVRKPNSEERASAVKIARQLSKARYRNRTETKINSVLPQGRLRSRAVVQREAYRSKGILTPVETWKHKTRKHTETPDLTIGIMVDVSGSMGSAMKPMASTAWILSEAGRRVQAKTSMVYFGSGVFPTLRVGQRLEEVNVYTAPDGTEKFDLAFQALNGQLDLLDGKSARLLVVVSDACYTREEIEATRHWLDRCKKSGVGVLWITYEAGLYVAEVAKGSDTQIVKVGTSITEVADIVGKAGAEALTKAGNRQGR